MKPSRWSVSVFSFVLGVFTVNAGLLASRYLGAEVPSSPYLEGVSARGSVLRCRATPAFIECEPCERRAALVAINAKWRAARPDCWSTEVVVEDGAGRYLGSLISAPDWLKINL